jgi:hypothetical protein
MKRRVRRQTRRRGTFLGWLRRLGLAVRQPMTMTGSPVRLNLRRMSRLPPETNVKGAIR